MEGLGELLQAMMYLAIILLIIVIVVYILVGRMLSRLNEKMYGKRTILAYIPIVNYYILGKLTINKVFGWVLVIGSLLNGSYSYTGPDGVTVEHTILPKPIGDIYGNVFSILTLILVIYAAVKLHSYGKKEVEVTSEAVNNTNPVVSNDSSVNTATVINEEPTTAQEQPVEEVPTHTGPEETPSVTPEDNR